MLAALAALLCLGLSLSAQASAGQPESLAGVGPGTRGRRAGLAAPPGAGRQFPRETRSRPLIWAEPSAAVPKGTPVTVWCQGAPDAEEFRLHFEGGLFAQETPSRLGRSCRVHVLIPAMSSNTAGRYRCCYRSAGRWSEPSEALDLVVTGMYDTPTLWVHPGPEVTWGERVTLYCRLETATNTFFLLKEGRPSRARPARGTVQAEFPLGPATAAHQGTYRCFGSYNSHTWSFPSEPMEIRVAGGGNTSITPLEDTPAGEAAADAEEPCPELTEPGALKGPWDPWAENLLRLGLALLVLAALAGLLAEDRLGGRRARTAGAEGAGGAAGGGARRARGGAGGRS